MIYLGVPCSKSEHQSHIPCTREDEAIAIGAGMWLCGLDNIEIFMQNSGFGLSIDVITSLIIPYGIKLDYTIYAGEDVPQHQPMNKIYKQLYDMVFNDKN
jgi:sulfopyruvate decarboxylase TPP-binding subunit